MSAIKFKTRSTYILVAIMFVMLVAAIAIPIYISNLDGTEEFNGQQELLGQKGTNSKNQQYRSTGALQFKNGEFMFHGNSFRIISGSIHYYRSQPRSWEDLLLRLKSLGGNTVQIYVPWNLHEEYPGSYNFEGMLNMREFIQLAAKHGLYVIFRPGPYICSEWDFGGLPAWLLSDPNMQVRTNYQGYKDAVERYFDKLLPMVTDLQHSKGGPIIAFQVENEYGNYVNDVSHLKFLRDLYIKHGLQEMFITSDNFWGQGQDDFYKYALPTANFKEFKHGKAIFDRTREVDPEFPLMATEFWTGWFDHWTSEHKGWDVDEFADVLMSILKEGASVNFYMFHGGTNFGFMNGANFNVTYKPDVTSYDYDALLSEAGDVTIKFHRAKQILKEHIYMNTTLPEPPANSTKKAYAAANITSFVPWETVLNTSKVLNETAPIPMEMLKLVDGKYGQNYGFILYRCEISNNASSVTLSERPNDRAQIFVDGKQIKVIDWTDEATNLNVSLTPDPSSKKNSRHLDILVENHGRVNFSPKETGVLDNQRKGLSGNVTIDGNIVDSFKVYPLEFKSDDVTKRTDWSTFTTDASIPGLFQTTLNINEEPADTFVLMKGWGKGVVFVNGFNIGRYWEVGPQQTLYLPAQVLNKGNNQIIVFEQEKRGNKVYFKDTPILDVMDQTTITV